MTLELSEGILRMLESLAGAQSTPEMEALSILRTSYLVWAQGRSSGLASAHEIIEGHSTAGIAAGKNGGTLE